MENLSKEAIKSNIEFYKLQKEYYSNLHTEALLNEIKWSKLLNDMEEEDVD